MHEKEAVIGPLLRVETGLEVSVPAAIDTDQFGTFSRETPRAGSQIDAARAKIAAGLAADAGAEFGLASEGSFGPHPHFPFVAVGREIVLLSRRDGELELVGEFIDMAPSFLNKQVRDSGEALDFALGLGFPDQGLIVTGWALDRPVPERFLAKEARDVQALGKAVREAVELCGTALVETDMRAHRNPRRRQAIAEATRDLIRRMQSACPACSRPGFVVSDRLAGLPCAACGAPTRAIRLEMTRCAGCGHCIEAVVAADTADPGLCALCNP
jgi:hypothetical protein